MNDAVPGIFNQVDGLASHSYPNPAFAQPPNTTSLMGTGSFIFERKLAKTLSQKDLPVFITETGWSTTAVSPEKQATYYQQAFSTIWNDPNVVAVAPFLLQGSGGPFEKFSLLDGAAHPTKPYDAIRNLTKVKGAPTLSATVLAAETHRSDNPTGTPKVNFSKKTIKKEPYLPMSFVIEIYKWLVKI